MAKQLNPEVVSNEDEVNDVIESSYRHNKLEYVIGNKTGSGEVVRSIVASCNNVIVFWSERDVICFEHRDLDVNSERLQFEYNRIRNNIPDWLTDNQYNSVTHQLAYALYSAFVSSDIDEAKEFLTLEEDKIKKLKSPLAFKLHFIITNFLCCLCLVLLCLSIYFLLDEYKEWSDILLCTAAGSVGSLFSLLQRGKDISTEIADKDLYIIIQAVIHNFFGAIAGGVLFLACMGNLVFGLFYDDIYALLTIAIIAGFSERFVPDLLNKIADKETKAAI